MTWNPRTWNPRTFNSNRKGSCGDFWAGLLDHEASGNRRKLLLNVQTTEARFMFIG